LPNINTKAMIGGAYFRIRHIPAYGKSSICWKDHAHNNQQRKMTLRSDEFLRRFFLHVLPHGFMRIRFFGFLANRSWSKVLPLCRRLLDMLPSQQRTPDDSVADAGRQRGGNVRAAPGRW
jgi:hypothetical protein